MFIAGRMFCNSTLGYRSLKRTESECSRPPSFALPCIMDVTFTRQVTKKNKVFSEGKLSVGETFYLKITDEFDKFVGSSDLGSNSSKRSLFCQQYLRAIENSQGLIQGVIEGVIFHVDCPPLLQGLVDDVGEREAKVACEGRNDIVRVFVNKPLVEISEFVAADRVSLRVNPQFVPVSSVDELMSLRPVALSPVENPDWRLRLINGVYKEVFEGFHNLSKSAKLVTLTHTSGWRLEAKQEKLYLCLPPGESPPKLFVDVFSIILGGIEALFRPEWKGFDPKSRIQVKAFSKEAQNILSVSKIMCVRGLCDLSSPVELVTELKKMTRSCVEPFYLDSCPVPSFSYTSDIFFEDSGSNIALTAEQETVVSAVKDWFKPQDVTREEVKICVSVKGVFGAGKSTILAHCVKAIFERIQAVPAMRSARILVMASTNIAVDNVLNKVRSLGIHDMARIGLIDRIDPLLRDKFTDDKREIKKSRIIGSTASSACGECLVNVGCDFVLIDESYQLSELSALLALLRVNPLRVLLFGDPRQLGRINCASEESIITAMEKFCPPARHLRLEVNTQFRCRQQIADICSNLFYQGLVKTHESVLSRNTHLLSVLPAVGVIAHHHKSTKGTLSSQQNLQEAELVIHFIKKKIDFFQHEKKSVAIISFFCAQVALLSQLVRETGLDPLNLQVHTVDSCQGAEADIVILSVVSSDSARSFKFIADPNRLNVALSRAKDHLIIFANESVLKTEPYSSICRSSNVLTL